MNFLKKNIIKNNNASHIILYTSFVVLLITTNIEILPWIIMKLLPNTFNLIYAPFFKYLFATLYIMIIPIIIIILLSGILIDKYIEFEIRYIIKILFFVAYILVLLNSFLVDYYYDINIDYYFFIKIIILSFYTVWCIYYYRKLIIRSYNK